MHHFNEEKKPENVNQCAENVKQRRKWKNFNLGDVPMCKNVEMQ